MADQAMEEQEYEDMQVPPHMDPQATGGAAPTGQQGGQPQPTTPTPQQLAEAEAAAIAARQQHESNLAEFVAAAAAKPVDISDLDLAAITPEMLRQVAEQRLA